MINTIHSMRLHNVYDTVLNQYTSVTVTRAELEAHRYLREGSDVATLRFFQDAVDYLDGDPNQTYLTQTPDSIVRATDDDVILEEDNAE